MLLVLVRRLFHLIIDEKFRLYSSEFRLLTLILVGEMSTVRHSLLHCTAPIHWDFREIWRYWHIHCVSAAMIERALENGVFGSVADIPTMVKPGQATISPERREECNELLLGILNVSECTV